MVSAFGCNGGGPFRPHAEDRSGAGTAGADREGTAGTSDSSGGAAAGSLGTGADGTSVVRGSGNGSSAGSSGTAGVTETGGHGDAEGGSGGEPGEGNLAGSGGRGSAGGSGGSSNATGGATGSASGGEGSSATSLCDPDPCVNGVCYENGESFICECQHGFGGTLCDTELESCDGNPCANGGECVTEWDTVYCICADGYAGGTCETDIDECVGNGCENGSTCVDGINGYTCECIEGYEGTRCEINTDDCDPNPCLNDGTCSDLVDGYQCNCPEGFYGIRCEVQAGGCEDAPCQNGSACTDVPGGTFSCACEAGYTGTICELNIDDCSPNPCVNGTCTDGVADFACSCATGWQGELCDSNPNDCPATNPCQHGGSCVDGLGSYSCNCAAGFTGGRCETNIDECSPNPCVNGTCTDGVADFTCGCATGWQGELCDSNPNDCPATNPCQHGGSCVDGLGSYSCACTGSYTGDRCETSIGTCTPNPCQNGGTCTLSGTTAVCECPEDFSGSTCEVTDLMGWWRFDGSGADSSGHGNTATIVSPASILATSFTEFGSVLDAGTHASPSAATVPVTSSSTLVPTRNQITMWAWVQPGSSAHTQRVIVDEDHNSYELALSGTGRVFARFNRASSGANEEYAHRVESISLYPTNGDWMHLAATYDGATIRIYINGRLEAEEADSFVINPPTTGLRFGGCGLIESVTTSSGTVTQCDASIGFVGSIEDIRLYNRALSEAEIQERLVIPPGSTAPQATVSPLNTFATSSLNQATMDKPQSKTWYANGYWWTVLATGSAGTTQLYRLDGSSWTSVLSLDSAPHRADCDPQDDGTVAVLLTDMAGDGVELTEAGLVRLTPQAGTPASYSASAYAAVEPIDLMIGAESVVTATDSTGRQWVAWVGSRDSGAAENVWATYRTGDAATWAVPIQVSSGSAGTASPPEGDQPWDEIVDMIALPDEPGGSAIAVMWSNQADGTFHFRMHRDAATAEAWEDEELPFCETSTETVWGVSCSAHSFSDDHVSLAVAPDGTLYAAIKTNLSTTQTAGIPSLALLERYPGGGWGPDDTAHIITTERTPEPSRPVVAVSSDGSRLAVAYGAITTGGDILYRTAAIEPSLHFGGEALLISEDTGCSSNTCGLTDVTTTRQNFGSDVVFLASSFNTTLSQRVSSSRLTFLN